MNAANVTVPGRSDAARLPPRRDPHHRATPPPPDAASHCATSGVTFLSHARDPIRMPEWPADEPAERRNALVRAIVAHRRGGGGDGAGEEGFGAGDDADSLVLEGAGRTVTYADRSLRLEVDPAERERLEALCAEYRVFKVAQPETRKAPDGVVYLSAVTDAKHAADFVEAMFREVFEAKRDYELRVR